MAATFSGSGGVEQTASFKWRGLTFRNPLGIAGGVDKSGSSLKYWQRLSAGFLEVGTVTPQPQGPNPGSIMSRDLKNWSLWNKMGFPSPGSKKVEDNLKRFSKIKKIPLFINIGKNRETSNDQAHIDYIYCIEKLAPYADAFVVNISSPNTKSLRDLQSEEPLERFLSSIQSKKKELCLETPILLKLSPDLEPESLTSVLKVSTSYVDGWILTNTTKSRPLESQFPVEGGLSGRPLAPISRQILKSAVEILGERKTGKLLVSSGGVMDERDAQWRLNNGADLVQIYSGLVFEGPHLFQKILRAFPR